MGRRNRNRKVAPLSEDEIKFFNTIFISRNLRPPPLPASRADKKKLRRIMGHDIKAAKQYDQYRKDFRYILTQEKGD